MKYKTKNMNLQLFAGDTITDLTGTTWELNNNITTAPSGWSLLNENGNYEEFFINFSTYTTIVFVDSDFTGNGQISYNSNNSIQVVYTTNLGWSNSEYKTIEITGGTDATNQDLISWLQANATLVSTPVQGYSSTITLTNCTCNKSSETGLSGSYSATITADDGYYLSSVTTTLGTATIAENKKTATISISDVTEDFTITATGTIKTIKNVVLHPDNNGTTDYTTDLYPQVNSATTQDINNLFVTPIIYPSKGDIIEIDMDGDGIAERYRVLKSLNGNVFELLSITDHIIDIFDGEDNTYENSDLDIYLNTTWYNTLSSQAKSAIIDKTFTQDSWYGYHENNGNPIYQGTYYYPYDDSNHPYSISLGTTNYGNSITRHIYALSVQDIIDYLEVTSSMTSSNTTLTAENLWEMFGYTQLSHPNSIWLRSAIENSITTTSSIYNNFGAINFPGLCDSVYANENNYRPAFQIDLSQITWSLVE